MLVDLWSTDKQLLNDASFKRNPARAFFQKTDADKLILNDKSEFRVFNLQNPWNEARTSYYHNSIGGYHGAKIRRYQDLIEKGLIGEQQELISQLRSGDGDFSMLGILNMLNTKYFVAGPTKDAVISNRFAEGNAWFVSFVTMAESPEDELNKTLETIPSLTAIIDQSKFEVSSSSFYSEGTINLTSYKPNHLIYQSDSKFNSLAVFSEIYYKNGWKATIDGKEAPILRANYVLRALEVPKGNHTIEFTFEPSIYNWANPIMMASSWLIILLILGTLAIELGFVTIRND